MNILIVDDREESTAAINPVLEEHGHVTTAVLSTHAAQQKIETAQISLVILNWGLADSAAQKFCIWLRNRYTVSYIFILSMTDSDDLQMSLDAFASGSDDVIKIPTYPEELAMRIKAAERVIEYNGILEKKNQRLVATFDRLMKDFMEVTSDLADAGRVQKSLLPESASFDQIAVHGYLKSAAQLAGDSYDYFKLGDDHLAFYIADAVGHGSAAAMVSYAVHHQIKPRAQGICSLCFEASATVEAAVVRTIEELNHQFVTDSGEDNRWFTMIYGLIDLSTGEVILCQAGQPPALHSSVSKDAVEEVGAGGFPVGLLPDASYTTSSCVLKPGDRLLVCSDGAVECASPDDEEFGVDRLKEVLKNSKEASLEDMALDISQNLVDWNGSNNFQDDISVLLFQHAA